MWHDVCMFHILFSFMIAYFRDYQCLTICIMYSSHLLTAGTNRKLTLKIIINKESQDTWIFCQVVLLKMIQRKNRNVLKPSCFLVILGYSQRVNINAKKNSLTRVSRPIVQEVCRAKLVKKCADFFSGWTFGHIDFTWNRVRIKSNQTRIVARVFYKLRNIVSLRIEHTTSLVSLRYERDLSCTTGMILIAIGEEAR